MAKIYYLMILSVFLVIGVADSFPQNPQYLQGGQVFSLPFYGGAKGQVLQITRDPYGQILNQVVVPQDANAVVDDTVRIENDPNQSFQDSLHNIQLTAQRLVELQEKNKKSGQIKDDDQRVYASNLALLGQSASNLAQFGYQGNHDLSVLFTHSPNKQKLQQKKPANNRKGTVSTHQAQQFADDEEDVGEQTDGLDDTETNNGAANENDGEEVTPESDTASVAEAKPVAVAVAGEGGVASSKPVATAVVGPGGLAVARPVATAISGVDPSKVGFVNKPLAGLKTAQTADARQFLYNYQPLLRFVDDQPYYYPQFY